MIIMRWRLHGIGRVLMIEAKRADIFKLVSKNMSKLTPCGVVRPPQRGLAGPGGLWGVLLPEPPPGRPFGGGGIHHYSKFLNMPPLHHAIPQTCFRVYDAGVILWGKRTLAAGVKISFLF